jgi:hypothetical protein
MVRLGPRQHPPDGKGSEGILSQQDRMRDLCVAIGRGRDGALTIDLSVMPVLSTSMCE